MIEVALLLMVLLPHHSIHLQESIRTSIPFADARDVFSARWSGAAADRVRRVVSRSTLGGGWGLISEDGKVVVAYDGTISKFDVETGALVTDNDFYRVDIRANKAIAFSVSQETYIRRSYTESLLDLRLVPTLLLDRNRTFCVSWLLDEAQAKRTGLPKNTAFLAVIDDRQRGPNPNRLKRIQMPFPVSYPRPFVEAVDGQRVLLRVSGLGDTRFLSVDLDTLEYRWVPRPRSVHAKTLSQRIEAAYPGILIFGQPVRWTGRTYFSGEVKNSPRASTMWHEGKLTNLGSFFVVGATANGKYAWLIDQAGGNQWLLTAPK